MIIEINLFYRRFYPIYDYLIDYTILRISKLYVSDHSSRDGQYLSTEARSLLDGFIVTIVGKCYDLWHIHTDIIFLNQWKCHKAPKNCERRLSTSEALLFPGKAFSEHHTSEGGRLKNKASKIAVKELHYRPTRHSAEGNLIAVFVIVLEWVMLVMKKVNTILPSIYRERCESSESNIYTCLCWILLMVT